MLMVISDTGYVCSASVLQGLGKDIDSKALQTVRKWHFKPALKDGQPVPVSAELFVTVDLNGNHEPQSTVKP
jgi:TonB family protein